MARSLPRSPGLCQGKGGAVASPHHHHLFFSQLPKGTEDLKRPSLSRLFHPPITEAIPLGHGESNRRCTLQVETRDVAALKALTCGFFPLPTSPVSILLPAPLLFYVSHGTRRGTGKVVSIFVCCCRLACMHATLFGSPYAPLQHATSTAHSLIFEQQPPNAQHCPCAIPVRPCPEQVIARRFPRA